MPNNAHFARKYAEISSWQYRRGLDLMAAAAPRPGDRILDLGCGTGRLSLELARRASPEGNVVAIDPDVDRLLEADAAKPSELDQLSFRTGKAQDLHFVAGAPIDLVYSNYAVHWVLDHDAMFREVERVLKPGGRFVAEFLAERPELLHELVMQMPDGKKHTEETVFREEAEWRSLIADRAFDVLDWRWLDLSLDFDSLPEFYEWFEGTSGGKFRVAWLPSNAAADYGERFPGPVSVPIKALRMDLCRR